MRLRIRESGCECLEVPLAAVERLIGRHRHLAALFDAADPYAPGFDGSEYATVPRRNDEEAPLRTGRLPLPTGRPAVTGGEAAATGGEVPLPRACERLSPLS